MAFLESRTTKSYAEVALATSSEVEMDMAEKTIFGANVKEEIAAVGDDDAKREETAVRSIFFFVFIVDVC